LTNGAKLAHWGLTTLLVAIALLAMGLPLSYILVLLVLWVLPALQPGSTPENVRVAKRSGPIIWISPRQWLALVLGSGGKPGAVEAENTAEVPGAGDRRNRIKDMES
jgi:hypothetical protein